MKEVKIDYIKTDLVRDLSSLDLNARESSLVRSKDPFIGYLSAPITDLKMLEVYLSLLPAYQTNFSPFLKGITVGLAHGYFLVGPFANLGPLRNTAAAHFAGFLAAASCILLLTCGLWMYGNTVYNSASLSRMTAREEVNFLNPLGWAQFTSGFALGGVAGNALACAAFVFIL